MRRIAAALCLLKGCVAKSTYTPAGSEFNATDYMSWLAANAAAGEDVLAVAPGSYTVQAAGSQQAHLVFVPLQNVLVDFTNVTLTMGVRTLGAVYLSSWSNVTMQGLTLRYAAPPSNSARILAVNSSNGAATVDVTVEAGMPTEDWQAGTVTSCDTFDGATRLQKPATWDLSVVKSEPLPAQNSYRLTVQNAGALVNVEAGDVLGCRIPNGGMTFHVDGAENCSFIDITLYGGPCFGFFHTGSSAVGQRGNSRFLRPAIRRPDPPPGAIYSPPLSTSADGFHCSGVPWGPAIEDAYFEGMNDDGIAIHGIFTLVTDAEPSTGRIWVAAQHGKAMYVAGDSVLLYDDVFNPQPVPDAPWFSRIVYTILDVEVAPGSYVPPQNKSNTIPGQSLAPGAVTFLILTLDTSSGAHPLPAGAGFDWICSNANRTGDGFVLRGNTIVNHRARGMLIKASNGLIESNVIANSSLGGVIVTPELYWEEADYVRGLVLRNNTISGVARARQGYGGIALGAVNPQNGLANGTGHYNVTIVDNTLVDVGYAPVWLSSAGNVTLQGNRVVSPFNANASMLPTCCEPVLNFVAVYATNVQQLLAYNNCVAAAPNGGGALQSLYNFTDTVTGDFVNGVVPC